MSHPSVFHAQYTVVASSGVYSGEFVDRSPKVAMSIAIQLGWTSLAKGDAGEAVRMTRNNREILNSVML